MAAEEAIEALRLLKIETEDAFNTENAAPALEDVRAIEPVFTRTKQVFRRAQRLQRLTMDPGRVHGRSEGNVTFGHEFVGAGTALSESVVAASDTLQKIMSACLGASYGTWGSTAAGGGNTTVFDVAAGEGTRFRAGTAIMCEGTGTGGVNEIGVIKRVAGDTITLEFALTSTPGAAAVIWNGYTSYIDPSGSTTLQAQMLAEANASEFLALGMVGKIKPENLLQLDNGPALLNFDLVMGKWETDAGTLAAGSYDEPAPLNTTEDLRIQYQTENTTTRNLLSVSALDIDPRMSWTLFHARGNGDINHADRVKMTGGVATDSGPMATFTADVDSAFLTAFDNKTTKMLCIMYGRTPGQSWCICLPRCEVVQVPGETAAEEQTASEVTLNALENDSGDASTALMRSPFFITRL